MNGNVPDNEEIWDVLGDEETRTVWEEAEASFWPGWFQNHDQVKADLKENFTRRSTDTRVELSKLTGERDQLVATKERLTRELLKIEQDLKRVNDEADKKAEQLVRLDQEYRQDLTEEIASHDAGTNKMKQFFAEKLGRTNEDEGDGTYNHERGVMTRPARSRFVDSEETEPELELQVDAMEGVDMEDTPYLGPAPPTPQGEVLVNVVDADDNVIGPIKRVEPWNQWVEAILAYPILRDVVIRRGRRFNEDHLAGIYDRAEGKGVKWLSCMIQATGKVQSRRCLSCDKNQGVFGSCIMVGGKLLHKCGNCEWNRQGCHGASSEFVEGAIDETNGSSIGGRVGPQSNDGPIRDLDQGIRAMESREAEPHELAHHENEHLPTEQLESEARERGLGSNSHSESDVDIHESALDNASRRLELMDQDSGRTTEEPLQSRPDSRLPNGNTFQVPLHDKPVERPADHLTIRQSVVEVRAPLLSGRAAMLPNTASQSVLQAPTGVTPPAETIVASTDSSARNSTLIDKRKNYDGPLVAPSPSPLPATLGFTAANVPRAFTPVNRSRPESRQSSGQLGTPTMDSAEPSPQPPDIDEGDDALEPITRENLILQHDGEVYTFPECVRGVPLVKVDENHPYWENDWKDLKKDIEAQRQKWEQKLRDHRENADPAKAGSSMKYQIGRQINRGLTILEFLEHGTISPYQLLKKGYLHTAKPYQKGGITSYDTLFRLCETIQELSKFTLDITPVEWMRHRLWEISMKKGKDFNCARIVHDFYHDPKLAALRVKHGYKNIGRPSGGGRKTPRQSMATNGATPQAPKRKSSYESETSDARVAVSLGDPLPASPGGPGGGDGGGDLDHAPKRLKTTLSVLYPEATDVFATDDFSDTDSVYGSPVYNEEFRVLQVKHRQHTSSTSSSQYWSWQPDRRCFEHQVVKSADPVKWGFIDKPVDFGVYVDEIAEIMWNLQTLRIYIKINTASDKATILQVDGNPRGDVTVIFKRERTMKRFLFFCRSIKIPLVRMTPDELNPKWDAMQSVEQIPSTQPPMNAAVQA